MKKLVCESWILNETYESNKELERIIDPIMKGRDKLNTPRTLKDLFKKVDLTLFPILRRFLQSDVKLVFDSNAQYPMFAFPPYEKEDIKMYPYLNNEEPAGIVIINNDEDSLLHELQHAFDYFRSNGKMAKSKKIRQYQKIPQDFSNDEHNVKYMHQEPEQSAYFTEVFKLTKNMRPNASTKDAFELFKKGFTIWDKLSTNDKKNLTRKFWQHWQKYQEDKKK